jgi:UDP-2,3-diacylglucosamine hydrolase
MRLLVVSDLHIRGSHDPLYSSLLSLLREEARTGDELILAGDVFDLFVGDKLIFKSRYGEFFEAVRDACERGVKLYYIEGNHDFLIRKAFRGLPGFSVHTHHVEIAQDGKRFFIAHGDTVDRKDYGYRALRLFFRSPVMRSFIRVAPGEWIDWIGRTSSDASRGKKPLLTADLPRERAERLRKVYRNFAVEKFGRGYDFVVLGHCHDLDEMTFRLGERIGQYINVGYPRVHGTYLEWAPGDEAIRRKPMPELPEMARPTPIGR